jgi:HlyD family secretion protein
VWVLDHGHIAPVTVRTGLTDGTVTELLGDGLQEGAQVVLDVTSTGKGSGALGGGSGGQRRPPMF